MTPRILPTGSAALRTLVVDIGGSGIKALVLDGAGRPLTARKRIHTPSRPTPGAVLKVIQRLAAKNGKFDRISVGFPGVVRGGVTETAQLAQSLAWVRFRLPTSA